MSELKPLSKNNQDWQTIMNRYEQSGLNRKQFCQDNNLALSTFKYYRTQLKKSSSLNNKTPLIPIHIKPLASPASIEHNHFLLVFNNGIQCQIPFHFAPEQLTSFIEVIQAC